MNLSTAKVVSQVFGLIQTQHLVSGTRMKLLRKTKITMKVRRVNTSNGLNVWNFTMGHALLKKKWKKFQMINLGHMKSTLVTEVPWRVILPPPTALSLF